MDFHALPRRDLQALCKRNSIRANMTNAAMADALGALPAVDGIEEYVKQPAADPTPAANPTVTAVADDEQRYKDTAPALGLGRCALAEPVVAPATKRRAAASKTEAGCVASDAVLVPATRRRAAVSKTEPMATRRRRAAANQTEAGDVAKEAVPAPTTRERRQMAVALVAEEKVPRARRTARKAPVTKTDMQQEEEGEGTQGVISDVKTAVPAPVSDEGEGRDEPDNMEEAMNPENEERNEVAEESIQEEEEILGAPIETATPVEEEQPLAEDCTDNSSVQERQIDARQREDLQIVPGLVEQQECAPFRDIAGIGEGPLDDEVIDHASEETEIVSVKEEAQATLDSVAAKANEAGTEHGVLLEEQECAPFRDIAGIGEGPLDDEVIHHASEETEIVPVKEEAHAMLESVAAKANEAGTEHGVLLEEQECAPFRDIAGIGEGPLDDEVIHHASEETEIVPVKEEAHAMLESVAAKANEAGTEHGVLLEEKEGRAVHEVLHGTHVAVEEEVVLATDKMPRSSATVNVDVEEVFIVNDLTQLTATDVEGASEERAFTGDLEENEAGTEDGFLLQEKEGLAVDEVLHDTDEAVEDEGVVATDNMPQSSATVNVDVEEEVFTVDHLSQLMAADVEGAGEESAFTGDLPPVFCDVHKTSPFFARMLDDITKSVSMDSDTVEAKVSEEAGDVSPCMYNNSNEKNITESVAVEPEEEKEVGKSEAMGNLSLRKLRLKLKETVAVGQENEVKEGKEKYMDSVTVEPYVSEEAGDASLCVYNNSNEKNITELVAVEQEKEVKQGSKSEAIGDLSLRKLRLKLKEKVAVGQENEVKEGKKSMALDKLSLRKLRTKLRETLNAHKSREPNRAPLGRLDENVC